MRFFIVILLSVILSSCGQEYNSNYFDAQKYQSTIDRSTPAGERLYNAFTVVQKNCISCHLGYHNTYSANITDAKWIASGLVNAGDFAGSTLISILKNYGGTMPQGGSSLSASDIESLKIWIENL